MGGQGLGRCSHGITIGMDDNGNVREGWKGEVTCIAPRVGLDRLGGRGGRGRRVGGGKTISEHK